MTPLQPPAPTPPTPYYGHTSLADANPPLYVLQTISTTDDESETQDAQTGRAIAMRFSAPSPPPFPPTVDPAYVTTLYQDQETVSVYFIDLRHGSGQWVAIGEHRVLTPTPTDSGRHYLVTGEINEREQIDAAYQDALREVAELREYNRRERLGLPQRGEPGYPEPTTTPPPRPPDPPYLPPLPPMPI
jgi:hypothetical protein